MRKKLVKKAGKHFSVEDRIAAELKAMDFHRWVHFPISKIAELLRLKTIGWIRNKYRRFRKQRWYAAYKFLQRISKDYPTLFVHWKYESFRP
jgi:hypothetical protein